MNVPHGEMRNAYTIFVGNLGRIASVARSTYTWVNTIKMDLKGPVWESVNWIYLAQERDLSVL
jgi:hypothetical protein